MLFVQDGLVGLENLGATCYINTFLQVCHDFVVALAHLNLIVSCLLLSITATGNNCLWSLTEYESGVLPCKTSVCLCIKQHTLMDIINSCPLMNLKDCLQSCLEAVCEAVHWLAVV